ncbi:MAG: glycoside hydrolase family 76 [Segetibacter sp.]|nr:glycoside hydrolase family 76 [Segetibacter sp.]
MIVTKKSILLLITILLVSSIVIAQKRNSSDGYFKKEMTALRSAIQKNFYDSAAGYYKEVVTPEKNHNPYSYLWPICAMYQAANEIEKIEPGVNLLQPMLTIIRDYYDPAPPRPGYASYIMKLKGGDRFYDDNQWLGITSMDAYTRKKNKTHLNIGKEIYDYMMTGFDTVLNGGIYWQENKKISKNTCSNGPGIILALQLYKATKDKAYLDTALLLYTWMNENLKSPKGLYYDNINIKNKRIGKAQYSYNTGTMLQSNVYLYECTGDKKYLKEATAIADSSLSFFYGNNKFRDNYWFNAVLLRGYQHLLQHNKDVKYILGFKKCLNPVLQNEKNEQGLFGKGKVLDLVAHAGMLEILARFALLEKKYHLNP